jgi:hypothetical protein
LGIDGVLAIHNGGNRLRHDVKSMEMNLCHEVFPLAADLIYPPAGAEDAQEARDKSMEELGGGVARGPNERD